jgi:hypothetical protein
MKARLIKEIGTRAYLRIYWDGATVTKIEDDYAAWKDHNSCPNAHRLGKPGYHNAQIFLGTNSDMIGDSRAFGSVVDYPADRWPKTCDNCGAPVPDDSRPTKLHESGVRVHHQIFTERLYDSPSGSPEPGDVYEMDWHSDSECPYWDNCTGLHLYALLPNGEHWDITSRASNCTMKHERTHRCWVVHGTAPNLTVNKNGHTCAAGAGSIAAPGYHGFLTNGEFVP